MISTKKLVLDILKPHQPSSIDFSSNIARVGDDYRVILEVLEMDEETETVQLTIEGEDLDFDAIQSAITDMSGSVHSIDVVEVLNTTDKV